MLIVTVLSLKSGGVRLAAFAVASLGYIVIAGYWPQSMNTLSLVFLAVPTAVGLGFTLGVLGYRFPSCRPILLTVLDLMQTVPAFAYLIPLLLLFGFGPFVGLVASAIYATPPMVRNTILGLDQVPNDVRESGLMSGCTRRQQFWHVEVPSAMPQMLIGFNQTTMAALSMVIIAAVIGGFADIGWEVLSSMRKANFGQSVLSGLVIALLAILIDRVTLGFAKGDATGRTPSTTWMSWRRFIIIIVLGLIVTVTQRHFWPDAWALPSAALRQHVEIVNASLMGIVRDYAWFFDGVRNIVLYSLLLPLRLGLVGVAMPALWGFVLTPTMILIYALIWLMLAVSAMKFFGWRLAVAACMSGLLLFQGFAGFPWPALVLGFGLLAYRIAGIGLACFAMLGFGFVFVSGLSVPLSQSMYLTTLAVIICLTFGGLLEHVLFNPVHTLRL
ncbi:hypothetical protein AU467_30405 [Mesorhizobium loti]|uniref:ABC transmembrane type-1 domain-containing protein n=1 Tax=Rhizobium loti TaxID=381 RepID=A0A101KP98_RHILI|nr:hypothetical protein AU467_30405 [Mesorhizobium loti]